MIANVIIPNDELRERWLERVFQFVNPLSLAGACGVYRNGEPWLTTLREYLDNSFREVKSMLDRQLPKARFKIPDATYLAWIDLSAYFPFETNLTRLLIEKAGVIVEGGEMFISDADGWIRLNIACPRATLIEGLERIIDAVQSEGTS